jgi:hypothetical protein
MSTTILSLLLLETAFGQAETEPSATDTKWQEELRFLKEAAAEFVLYRTDSAGARLTMNPEAVLRYSNPLGGGQGGSGVTYLWLQGQRPVAGLSLSIRPADNHVYMECTSFGGTALSCLRQGAEHWSPKTDGPIAQRLPEAPAPASSKAQRLAQMRDIARRFSAASYTQADIRTELRLLTTPLYRFAAEDSGVLDGAVFAFVVSNDPELFLLLEAVRTAGGDSATQWQYSLARMSSRKETIRLDDKEIWSSGNFYRTPLADRKSGPYLEARLGPFLPQKNTPEGGR